MQKSLVVFRFWKDVWLSGGILGCVGYMLEQSWGGLGACGGSIFGAILRHPRLSWGILEVILGSPRRSCSRLGRKRTV
eukprot:5271914-Pyramimonas_sp.AAC.1